ncbi:MAG: NUDIX hydrolase [Ahniella sp.]|nr:NUDIX hydrolase [Ahniella sp.]
MHQLPIWRPDVTVAAVVPRHNRLLFVAERVRGTLVLNQPAGHLEHNETLLDAVVRETLEETRWKVQPAHLLGVYQWQSPVDGIGFLRFAFVAEALADHPERALDDGIEQVLWLNRAELLDCGIPLRSPLVLACVDDFLAGRQHAADLCRWVGTP